MIIVVRSLQYNCIIKYLYDSKRADFNYSHNKHNLINNILPNQKNNTSLNSQINKPNSKPIKMKKIITLNCSIINGRKTFKTNSLVRTTGVLPVILLMLMTLFGIQSRAQWTNIATLAPNNNYGSIMLLSDGRAFCKSDGGATNGGQNCGNIWNILTPDVSGSYVNGTWSSAAPMISERYSYPADVLMNGNVYVAGGEYGTDGTQNGYHAETYNPVTNSWTACAGTNSGNVISDGNSVVLANGNVLQSIVNQPYPTTTVIYNHTTNTFGAGPSSIGGQNESMWLKLPDSSILMVDEGTQVSERYIPSTNSWIADANVPVALYDPWGLEAGPALMLPDGRAIFFSALGTSAYYTPSGTTAPGTWATGPTMPNGTGMPDAPAAMMQNGKILLACSPVPTSSNEFASPTYWYEFDYTNNTYTAVNAPTGGASFNGISQQVDLLNLPNGQVLCCINSDPTSQQYYVYTPTGPIVTAGKPIVNSVTAVTCTEYIATGKNFNGISQGSAFGDENQNDSNYPIVKLTSGGNVYYCRSHDWNSSDIWTGNRESTTGFTLPSSIPSGTYNLYVIANGISSDSIQITLNIPTLSSTLTPPAICSGTAFTYSPTSNTVGATFTWTRAAVTGISNAAITNPQISNPNEILINTTTSPVTVVYTYTITGNGCTNIENVSVIVNPPPTASFIANTVLSCQSPDTVTFTNTTLAGGTYIWYFGDGDTSTATNPVHLYLTSGSYTVKLVTVSACGTDSMTQANYIVVNSPAAPTVTSPDTIACGGIATLIANSADSMQWYNQPTGGTLLGTGSTYVTPALFSNTTYYVESGVFASSDYCPPATDAFGTGGNFGNSNYRSEIFNVLQQCTLVSVVVYSSAAGNRTIDIEDVNNNVLQSTVVNIPNGTSTVTLNFPLTVGTGYQLGCGDGSTATNLYRNSAGANYPYSDPGGYVTITGNNVPDPARYYFFYNWDIQGPTCVSSRTPVDVIINGGPTSSFTYTNAANVFTFTNTSTNSTSWLWNFGDGNTSPLQNPVHTYINTGTYTVTLTAYNNGCFDSTSQTIMSVGMPTYDFTNALSIYPNPTDGLFNVSAKFSSVEQINVSVINTLGQIIYETNPVTASSQLFTLDLRKEAKGIYFVELKTKNGSVVKKLVLN